MAKKTWHINLNGQNHTVGLTHNYWISKREITVDGEKIELPSSEKRPLIDFGGDINFKIGEHPATILIRTGGITYNYDLLINGISKKTGEKVSSTNKYSLFWGEISNKQIAEQIIKDAALITTIIVGLSALLLTFFGELVGWIDFVIVGLLGFWMHKKHSLLAVILLTIVVGAELAITMFNKFNSGMGTNIFLAALIFFLSIRSFQAILWLKDNNNSPEL